MQSKFFLLFLTSVLLFNACQKSKFIHAKTIDELNNYTNVSSTEMGQKVTHEEEEVFVQGYIFKVNEFRNENRFLIFNTDILSNMSSSIQINIIKNQKEIFDKIDKYIGSQEKCKIYIKGKIISEDLTINNESVKSISLEIDKKSDIRF
ncbi:MAG: hypothetical protein HYR91_11470 [Flavobacteriia bacterium]|nr:hypothetical protein [Flavobacteriia bacterium]